MDFMKIFDQTVREIKREVNLKVLKVPEIEQKVLDATDDEPWGPHGTVMAEIAHATKKYSECQMVMNVLWSRLSESGRNWRYVYKSLAVIEYLVANGSERSIDDIIEHTYQISALSNFKYVEPNGKDMGINVRKKAETIVALLNNKDKIQEIRNKASATRDKYFGVSSTGVTYKSGSASFGSNSSSSGDRYGGFGNSRDSDATSGSYKNRDHFGDDKYVKSTSMPRRGDSLKDSSRHGRVQGATALSKAKAVEKRSDSKKPALTSSKSSIVTSNKYEDDFDDFDPRGTSSSKSAAGSSHVVDLFGQSLAGDLWDMPASVPNENPTPNSISPGVDLFANAAFVSAPSHVEAGTSFGAQPGVDLFASQPKSSSAVSSTINFFAAPDPVPSKPLDLFASQPENKLSEPEQVTTKAIDPFSSAPSNNFDNSDLFGSFSTNAHTLTKEPSQNLTDGPDFFGSFSPNADSLPKQQPSQNLAENDGHNNLDKKSGAESKSLSKDAFQVKSGIWADSLSRGLIDLNITAPKMVNLADVGIVGGLIETNEAAQAPSTSSYYAGRAMGAGSGLGGSSFTSSATELDDMFSNYSSQKNQFDGFPK